VGKFGKKKRIIISIQGLGDIKEEDSNVLILDT
jgi:hypothetical protein